MTAEEHIVAWIESSQPHYRRLLKLSIPGNFISNFSRASNALILASDAQREMIRGGDAYRSEQDEMALLRAAAMLCEWRNDTESSSGLQVRPVCPACGSSNMTRDGIISWNEDNQKWEFVAELDNETCQDCGEDGDCIAIWEPIEP